MVSRRPVGGVSLRCAADITVAVVVGEEATVLAPAIDLRDDDDDTSDMRPVVGIARRELFLLPMPTTGLVAREFDVDPGSDVPAALPAFILSLTAALTTSTSRTNTPCKAAHSK